MQFIADQHAFRTEQAIPGPETIGTRSERLPHLDVLRGSAAVVVVLHHAWLSLHNDPAALYAGIAHVPLFNLIALGRPAVVLFFVLSGFVLTLSLQARSEAWWRFAVRRACRLLPASWTTLALAALLFAVVPTRDNALTHMQAHIELIFAARRRLGTVAAAAAILMVSGVGPALTQQTGSVSEVEARQAMSDFVDKVFLVCLVAAFITGAILGHMAKNLADDDRPPLVGLLDLTR